MVELVRGMVKVVEDAMVEVISVEKHDRTMVRFCYPEDYVDGVCRDNFLILTIPTNVAKKLCKELRILARQNQRYDISDYEAVFRAIEKLLEALRDYDEGYMDDFRDDVKKAIELLKEVVKQ